MAVPIDFKLFTKLRTLRGASSAWLNQLPCDNNLISNTPTHPTGFILRLPADGRMDIPSYLPPCLEDLTISFVWPNAIFAHGWSYTSLFKLVPQTVQMKGFDCIMDLLKKNIKKIKLVEEAGGDHARCSHWGRAPGAHRFHVSQIKLPEAAQQACSLAGVELEIFLLDEPDHAYSSSGHRLY